MVCYRGKMTSCHTQALFNAFFRDATYQEYLIFEALTTNPFGVKHITNDPNRILDSYLDFDLGLDRALSILNIKYRTLFFENDDDIDIAILKLIDWLKENVVVVGPLNMQDLRYLYYPQLYTRLDHYIVILKYQNNKFYFLDSEGISNVSLDIKEFVMAWSGDKIIEGRGKFMMRQLLGKNNVILNRDIILKTLRYSIDNLYLSQKDQLGGSNAYNFLSKLNINSNLHLSKGLTYAIPNSLQKIFVQQYFFRQLNISTTKINNIMDNQISIFNSILFNILEKKHYDLKNFKILSQLEKDFINEMEKILGLI